jgi:hypothetical protein
VSAAAAPVVAGEDEIAERWLGQAACPPPVVLEIGFAYRRR